MSHLPATQYFAVRAFGRIGHRVPRIVAAVIALLVEKTVIRQVRVRALVRMQPVVTLPGFESALAQQD